MSDANHRTRWTTEEDEFLQAEWDGHVKTALIIADILGRTLHATTQRHYQLTWGTAADPVQDKPLPGTGKPKIGVTARVADVMFTVDPDKVCPGCWTLKSCDGHCLCNEGD